MPSRLERDGNVESLMIRKAAVIFTMEELEKFQRSEAELLPPGASKAFSFAEIGAMLS